MKHEYKMKGTCALKLTFDLGSDNKVRGIQFVDGCEGNLGAVALLAEGMDARELADKLRGVKCGKKRTSCPDQLSQAVEQALQRAAQ